MKKRLFQHTFLYSDEVEAAYISETSNVLQNTNLGYSTFIDFVDVNLGRIQINPRFVISVASKEITNDE